MAVKFVRLIKVDSDLSHFNGPFGHLIKLRVLTLSGLFKVFCKTLFVSVNSLWAVTFLRSDLSVWEIGLLFIFIVVSNFRSFFCELPHIWIYIYKNINNLDCISPDIICVVTGQSSSVIVSSSLKMSYVIYGSSNVYRNFERARTEVILSEKQFRDF